MVPTVILLFSLSIVEGYNDSHFWLNDRLYLSSQGPAVLSDSRRIKWTLSFLKENTTESMRKMEQFARFCFPVQREKRVVWEVVQTGAIIGIGIYAGYLHTQLNSVMRSVDDLQTGFQNHVKSQAETDKVLQDEQLNQLIATLITAIFEHRRIPLDVFESMEAQLKMSTGSANVMIESVRVRYCDESSSQFDIVSELLIRHSSSKVETVYEVTDSGESDDEQYTYYVLGTALADSVTGDVIPVREDVFFFRGVNYALRSKNLCNYITFNMCERRSEKKTEGTVVRIIDEGLMVYTQEKEVSILNNNQEVLEIQELGRVANVIHCDSTQWARIGAVVTRCNSQSRTTVTYIEDKSAAFRARFTENRVREAENREILIRLEVERQYRESLAAKFWAFIEWLKMYKFFLIVALCIVVVVIVISVMYCCRAKLGCSCLSVVYNVVCFNRKTPKYGDLNDILSFWADQRK